MVLRKLFTVDSNVNGKGPVMFAWNPSGVMLAVVGSNSTVNILDRQGKTQKTFNLPASTAVVGLDWDKDGDILAVLQKEQSTITMYNASTKKIDSLETSIKDLCLILWSKTEPLLVAGSTKGNILIYNRDTFKKVPIMGKHSKKILAAAWNNTGQLALSSEDKTLTVSDVDGSTVDGGQINIKGNPTNLEWAARKIDGKTPKSDTTISMVNSGKTLVMHAGDSQEGLIELAFNKKYGTLVTFKWYGDGYIVAGFSNGNVIIVSTHAREIGTEVSMIKAHRDQLNDLIINKNIMKAASIGDNSVRVFDLDDVQLSEQRSEKFDFDTEFGALTKCEWTEDGQILTVASKNGNLYNFLTRIPVLSASSGVLVVYLSSLRELMVRDIVTETDIATVELDIEPAFVGLSSSTVAVGMNNQVRYFSFEVEKPGNPAALITDKQYPSTVEQVKVSPHYAAVLMGGQAVLHTITENSNRPQKTFPERSQDRSSMKVTCHAMTESFYIFGTSTGMITIFSLMDHTVVTEYRHTCGLVSLSPNSSGTRIMWIDETNAAHVLNPTAEIATGVDRFVPGTTTVLWDPSEYGCFVGISPKYFTTYFYSPNTRYGSTATAVVNRQGQIAQTTRPAGLNPVLAFRGVVICQLATGSLAHVPLSSHASVHFHGVGGGDPDAFHYNLQLDRLGDAVNAVVDSDPQQIQQIAERALHLLDIDMAIRMYRRLGRPAMVMDLEKIQHIREKNILLGYVALFFQQFTEAQNFFMRSSNQMLALEMRRDLMHYDQALGLAHQLAPTEVPNLSKESGQQLEFRGEFSSALEMYKQGHMELPAAREDSAAEMTRRALAQSHNDTCQAGVSRCMIRLGNVRQGMQIAMQSSNIALAAECAGILESMKQYEEAATLYEKAEKYEAAATIYIQNTKQLKAAQRLLPKLTSRNIFVLYAKAKEQGEMAYADAAEAYAQAEDWDNVVRIKVEHLNDLHGAHSIVRRTKSVESAMLVAKVCKKKGEINAAIEFLLLAKKHDEAFQLAKQNNGMPAFEQALLGQVKLKDGIAPPQYRETFGYIATHYENNGNHELAGDHHLASGNFNKALTSFLQSGNDEYIEKAIGVVGKAKSEPLTHQLLDYLMGHEDGNPKDPNFVFQLYIALKNYEKAAKTAVVIASRDQELGNYKSSHKILIDTVLVLQQKNMHVPADLRRTLYVLHSYLIVKHLVKPMEDHVAATRMLLKVARNIQKFPRHMAAILTSTVLQCVKQEFKLSAYQYARTLLQTEELKVDIPEKSKKKIEQVVRKRGKEELVDPPERTSLCPYCQAPVLETTLDCGACKNSIPMCIVTGRHMELDDWAECPTCKFPALHSQLLKLLKFDPKCPMCETAINPMSLNKIDNPNPKVYS